MRMQDPAPPPFAASEELKHEQQTKMPKRPENKSYADDNDVSQKYTVTKRKLFDMFARKVLKNVKKMSE